MDRVIAAINGVGDVRGIQKRALAEAEAYADNDIEQCRNIGMHGRPLIKDGMGIGTQCNAGALAFVDIGSATAPMYAAHADGMNFTVYPTRTEPRFQGAMLTTWELQNAGIRYYLISDSATAFHVMRGDIKLFIVGADCVTENGDTANKIGTLNCALACKEFGVPFYVAIPWSTYCPERKTGSEVPIEERSESEVLNLYDLKKKGFTNKITPDGARARNFAFDITPARYITGIITPEGIFRPKDLYAAYKGISKQ
jgi:S-methyl-5-thioribose-1-phosphate isomerase